LQNFSGMIKQSWILKKPRRKLASKVPLMSVVSQWIERARADVRKMAVIPKNIRTSTVEREGTRGLTIAAKRTNARKTN
jgi:hypothetical protein